MFTTKEAVRERTGIEVDQPTLAMAQLMVEAYIGRNEADVTNGSDFAMLGKAVAFQAVYIKDSPETWEQAAVTSIVSNGSTIGFDVSRMAPHMSPWVIAACRNLSWFGSRSVHTGPITTHDDVPRGWRYE